MKTQMPTLYGQQHPFATAKEFLKQLKYSEMGYSSILVGLEPTTFLIECSLSLFVYITNEVLHELTFCILNCFKEMWMHIY